jgi:hypothetical protein
MKIVSATIVRLRQGSDHVMLTTDLPEPAWPFKGELSMQFRTARGQAEAYLTEHFPGVPITTNYDVGVMKENV